jgi:LysR family cys regulon transcriptional activator
MNLRQLRYICEISNCNLSVSAAAQVLHTNQPGISKQVKLLESELGFEIFQRRRNRLSAVTEHGEKVIAMARVILKQVNGIRAVSQELKVSTPEELVIAGTHTQARYFLPAVVERFSTQHPGCRIVLRHANPSRISEMIDLGMAEIGITSDSPPANRDLLMLECQASPKFVVVPKGHPLTRARRLTLKQMAEYPLVSYEPSYTAGREIVEAFTAAGLSPRLSVIAISADLIKTFVERGMGIAVLSGLTLDAQRDGALRAIPAGHLFAPSVTRIFFSRHLYLQPHVYDFLEICSPRWTRSAVQKMIAGGK